MSVHGSALVFGKLTHTPAAGVNISPVSPVPVIAGSPPVPLATAKVAANAAFQIPCFDVAAVTMGLILLADDPTNTADVYYPTISGIAAFNPDGTNKYCIDHVTWPSTTATAFVLEKATLDAMNAIENINLTISPTHGVVIGMILDSTRTRPISKATVTKGDGTAIDNIYYPDPTFTSMGTETSATGIFVIQDFNLTSAPSSIIGVKTGCTWKTDLYRSKAVAGHAYFIALVAENDTSCTP
jgi:hypothetical protein